MAKGIKAPRPVNRPDVITASAADVALAYKAVFTTQEGAIVLADLMRHFGFTTTTTYVANDPNGIYRNEGQRSVLVHIGKRLETDPASIEATEKTEN